MQDQKNEFEDIKKPLKSYRNQFEKGWEKEEKAYYGDIWKNGQNRPYENFIFQTVETIVPILTDSLTGTVATSNDPAYQEQAKVLTQAIDWVYQDQDLILKQPILIRNSLVSAPGFLFVEYDQDADGGEGKINIEVVNWRNVWLDGINPFIERARKAVIELERDRNYLARKFPRKKEEIEKAKGSTSKGMSGSSEGRERYDVGGKYERKAPSKFCDDDILLYKIAYKKDYTLKKIPIEVTQEELLREQEALEAGASPDVAKWQDHKAHIENHLSERAQLLTPFGIEGNAPFKIVEESFSAMAEQRQEESDFFSQLLIKIKLIDNHIEAHAALMRENPNSMMPKYKNNWRVIKKVENITVYDGEPEDNHLEIPIVPFYCYHDETPYGFSEVRNLLDSQNMNAIMTYKEYKGLQKVANPEKHVDKETGLKPEDITNEDGAIYVLPQGTEIRNIQPGQISPQVSMFAQNRVDVMRVISGVNEATQGELPGPQTAAITVERIQQQAIGRIRLKQRGNEYYSMKRLGKIVASLILQHWTDEKVLKLQDEGGENYQVIFNPLDMKDLDYEIKPVPGSMAGVDKNSFNALLTQFLGAGHLTFEQYLQVAEIPRKDKILEMVSTERQKQELIAQLQQENELMRQEISSVNEMLMANQVMPEENTQALNQTGVIEPTM